MGRTTIYIPKIGNVRWIKHRPFRGKPKSIVVSQDGNKWYCSILCEYNIQEREMKDDNIVGCDVGLIKFITLSDGSIIENPRYLRKYEKHLTKEQRRLSRKKKGSSNRFKQRLKVRNVHAKVKNVRRDFLHKTTSDIIKKYDGIVLENLNIKNMMKNHYLSKSIGDVSWSEFKRQLTYKSLENFKHLIEIDRFEPTSKTCSKCGYVQEMPLSRRNFNCPECGLSLDRDLNAAINIKLIGLGRAELTPVEIERIASVGEAGKRTPG